MLTIRDAMRARYKFERWTGKPVPLDPHESGALDRILQSRAGLRICRDMPYAAWLMRDLNRMAPGPQRGRLSKASAREVVDQVREARDEAGKDTDQMHDDVLMALLQGDFGVRAAGDLERLDAVAEELVEMRSAKQSDWDDIRQRSAAKDRNVDRGQGQQNDGGSDRDRPHAPDWENAFGRD